MENIYIHFTTLNLKTIESIFKYGIMSKKDQIKNNIYNRRNYLTNNNGKHFVSLTKKTNINKSIYNALITNPNYIGIKVKLEKKPIKAKTTNLEILNMTSLPIRYSPYNDEWQTKEIITPDNFLSLSYPLDIIYKIYDSDDIEQTLQELENLKKLMKIYNIDIPLITNKKVYTK